MNIIKTKDGKIGLITNQQLSENCGKNISFAFGKKYNKFFNKKARNIIIKGRDLRFMYNIGNLINVVNNNENAKKEIFNDIRKNWKLNKIWDGNLIDKDKYEKKEESKKLKEDIKYLKQNLRDKKRELIKLFK